MSQVNDEMARNNDQNMFVTVFFGLLDLASGQFTYVNAGHNPPLLLRVGQTPEWLSSRPQIALGVSEDHVYQEQTLIMASGDRLLLYTDGVTEAMNPAGELYSEQRLIKHMAGTGKEGVRDAVYAAIADVREFAGSAEQSDDITLLLLEYTKARAA